MKLQLNEKELNAYINAALSEEIDELFGSRTRKQSRRMITGQGWGNQKRSTENGLGMAANSDISQTDADEVVPQTLVGMIKKMEQGLVSIEQAAGLPGEYESLGDNVAAYRNGGGFKMKQSLLNAINALGRLADRLNAVERKSGSNAIMESAGDYMDAAVGGNAAIGNARNMGQLGTLQQKGRDASKALSKATRNVTRTGKALDASVKAGEVKKAADLNQKYTSLKAAQDAARTASLDATKNLKAAGISRNTGFWGKQLANVKTGAADVKTGFQTMKGAGAYGKEAARLGKAIGKDAAGAAKLGRAAKVGQLTKGAGQLASGVGRLSQIPLLLLSIADEAARQGAQARQRKIVRTYNCASVLAKRMANIAQEIADAQGGQVEQQQELQEINVRKAKKSFGSIEQGMNQLSAIMKQIHAQMNAGQEGQTEMPQSLNTRQEIAQFQNWANEHGYKDYEGKPLNPDGIWGKRTAYVYDQIAQSQGSGQINESNAVMRALTDLENKVGTTGAGGRAYSDISKMSGGGNGSRSQNARATKFIIRTYPPVLNQYLNVLADAGADVRGLQPLPVDNRPHRDYDVSEIQAIDRRIQELLGVAQNLDGVKPIDNNKPVKLPPKPVMKPRPVKKPEQEPQAEKPAREEMPKLEPVQSLNLPTGATLPQDQQPRITDRPQVQATLPQNAVRTMAKTAAEDPSVVSQREKNHALRDMKNNALNAIDSDAYAGDRKSKRADKQFVRNGYRTIKRGDQHPNLEESRTKINETEFKKLVKQTILETLKK